MTRESDAQPPIACDLGAIDPARRSGHLSLVDRLLRESPLEVEELPDGLAFRFGEAQYATVAELVAHERLCCPFFRFVLDVTPQHGPVWLSITGPDGTRVVLAALAGR